MHEKAESDDLHPALGLVQRLSCDHDAAAVAESEQWK